jgi:hypothetical protein
MMAYEKATTTRHEDTIIWMLTSLYLEKDRYTAKMILYSEPPKPPSNGKPWSLDADRKAGFSTDRKTVQRYLTESGLPIMN